MCLLKLCSRRCRSQELRESAKSLERTPKAHGHALHFHKILGRIPFVVVIVAVVVVNFILSRWLYLSFSANLGLMCMPHAGVGPLA